ncbi:MAG: hypothetical protein K0R51_3224 [Cytophagaceae bacterium]|jgi:surface protein|nr:hypothetical protein [Cytophagaceae bacterium]
MKKQLTIAFLFLFSLIFSQHSFAQAFITRWQTNNPGVSSSHQIIIPGEGTYSIYWEEVGNASNNGTLSGSDETTVTFPSEGLYEISITGGMTRIVFSGSTDKEKILSVEAWGDIAWTNMEAAFYGCSNLQVNATDAPDLSNVISLSTMFSYCSTFNANINHWDVSTIRNMRFVFQDAVAFNQPLDNWNMSEVLTTEGMFYNAKAFHQPLNSWDVSGVRNMSKMFRGATAFNGNITAWNTGLVQNMSDLLYNAQAFNQSIGSWNVSQVTDMSYMFAYAEQFNQPLSTWNVGNVTNMEAMFWGAAVFNQDINLWDVSKVVTMELMFFNAEDFNQSLNDWDVQSVTKMYALFKEADAFNGNISNWNTSNVTDMSNMFDGAIAFNQDISGWDVSHVTNMVAMFSNASAFDQPIGNWQVGNVLGMGLMFHQASSFNQNLASWNMSSCEEMSLAYTAMSVANYDATLQGWSIQTVKPIAFAVHDLKYCNGAAARELLIQKDWAFAGDIEDCTTTSTKNSTSSQDVLFYPNPWKRDEAAKIEMKGFAQENVRLSLKDANGKTCYETTISGKSSLAPMPELRAGMYILILVSDSKQVHQKIILE